MTETFPCLVRIGDNIKKYKLFIFDREEISVGRSPDVAYCIMSGMISRCHAYFRKTQDNTWTVTDNKSLNGIIINGKRIPTQNAVTLQDGDTVQLGVTNNVDKQEFIYRFSISARVKRSRRESDDTGKPLKYKKSRLDDTDGIKLTQKSPECDNHVSSSIDIRDNGDHISSPYKLYKQKLEEFQRQEEEKRKEYQDKIALMQKMLEDKEVEQLKMKAALEQEKEEKANQGKLLDNLKETEAKLKSALELQQEEMEKEKEELKQQMQDELETQLKNKESSLLEQLQLQQETLKNEKAKVEDSLKQEMEKALKEKNKQLEIELTHQRDKLQKVIDSKELEKKVLESDLCETKAENVKTKEAMLSAREDVLNNFKDLMEVELQCSICSELFIKSTSLNCSHSYCSYCIEQWMEVKKECPICRTAITSHMRSIVLDSYIDKMVEQLDDEMRKRRKELVESRKEEQQKIDDKKNPQTAGGSGVGGGRGRRRTRGGPAVTRGGTAVARAASVSPNTRSRAAAIIISDEEERHHTDSPMTDSDSSDIMTDLEDSSDVEGVPGIYYGGYGRCFSCGRSGHWANGCPD